MRRHPDCSDACQNTLGNHAPCRGVCEALEAYREENYERPRANHGELDADQPKREETSK